MAASMGLGGIAVASAATPALHVKPGETWTVELPPGDGCLEHIAFHHHGKFISDKYGDAGTWSGGGSTISMDWTAGFYQNESFDGTWTKTPTKGYSGTFVGPEITFNGTLVKGAVAGC
jgi:hypothetical protein